MKRFQRHMALTLMVCVALAVAACGGSATAGSPNSGGGGASGGATAAPTATPKPKPTAVPKITVAFCQGIMTVAQANQIMNPPTSATTIRVDAPASGGGSCNYEYKPFHSVVSIVFGPTVIDASNPQAVLAALDKQIPQSANATFTTTPVSGVGDTAQFLTVVFAALPTKMASMQVIYGKIAFSCDNFNVQGASFATEQTSLTQVCKQYISQL